MKRRWRWASSSATTLSRLRVSMSTQGDSTSRGWSNVVVWKISRAQIICIHVVPHLGGVLITMSSPRNEKPSHRPLSMTIFLYRVCAGAATWLLLRDGLDSFEGAEHVASVPALTQEATERAPELGEEVVAQIERLG